MPQEQPLSNFLDSYSPQPLRINKPGTSPRQNHAGGVPPTTLPRKLRPLAPRRTRAPLPDSFYSPRGEHSPSQDHLICIERQVRYEMTYEPARPSLVFENKVEVTAGDTPPPPETPSPPTDSPALPHEKKEPIVTCLDAAPESPPHTSGDSKRLLKMKRGLNRFWKPITRLCSNSKTVTTDTDHREEYQLACEGWREVKTSLSRRSAFKYNFEASACDALDEVYRRHGYNRISTPMSSQEWMKKGGNEQSSVGDGGSPRASGYELERDRPVVQSVASPNGWEVEQRSTSIVERRYQP